MVDTDRLETICELPYTNKSEWYWNRPEERDGGPRRGYLRDRLADHDPVGDDAGNLWVTKEGESGYTVVVSSHMDTVFGRKREDYACETAETGDRSIVMGALDNGVGCYMNLAAVEGTDSDHTVHHVFTVNEEYGMTGADRFVDWMDELGEEPDLFIVLDATYGDTRDRTGDDDRAYIDGILSGRMEDWLEGQELGEGTALDRTILGDETAVYVDEARSIALGPAVYGDMHTTECYTDVVNIEEAQRTLEELLEADLDDMPRQRFYEPGLRRVRQAGQLLAEGFRGLREIDLSLPERQEETEYTEEDLQDVLDDAIAGDMELSGRLDEDGDR